MEDLALDENLWGDNSSFLSEDPCNTETASNMSALCSLLRNLSLEARPVLGQPRDVLVIVLYALVVLVSLFGNSLVCHVVLRSRKMRSKTNVLIANLAVSDLLMTTLNVPLSATRLLLDNWPFGELLCWLAPFLQATFVYVSSFTMTWIACDRYSVIVHPLRLRRLCPGQRAICAIWALAVVLSVPHGVFNRIVAVFTYRRLVRCQVQYPTPSAQFRQWLTLATFLTQYLVPLSLTCFVYSRVSRVLWARGTLGALTKEQKASHTKAKRKSVKMLLLVVLCFAVCWLPLNTYHLVVHFRAVRGLDRYNSSLFIFFHWLAMSSVCYNPFIYCWLNDSFRQGALSCIACLQSHSSLRSSQRRLQSPPLWSQSSSRHSCRSAHAPSRCLPGGPVLLYSQDGRCLDSGIRLSTLSRPGRSASPGGHAEKVTFI